MGLLKDQQNWQTFTYTKQKSEKIQRMKNINSEVILSQALQK